jgi:hypothetical protein
MSECNQCKIILLQDTIIKDQRETIKRLRERNESLQNGQRLKFISANVFDYRMN